MNRAIDDALKGLTDWENAGDVKRAAFCRHAQIAEEALARVMARTGHKLTVYRPALQEPLERWAGFSAGWDAAMRYSRGDGPSYLEPEA